MDSRSGSVSENPLNAEIGSFFNSAPPLKDCDGISLNSILRHQLETDSKILLEKAEMALKKHRMHMVVANELSTRKEEVTVVTGNEKICDKTQSDSDVEEPLIELVVGRHSAYVKGSDL